MEFFSPREEKFPTKINRAGKRRNERFEFEMNSKCKNYALVR